ncbi:MAG TPA: MFS transporter [Dehalococcoidia bacterium]|nr:MFS transporter [Dehalococcoidia bacterium]
MANLKTPGFHARTPLWGGGSLAIKNAWFTLAVAFIILFFSSGLRFAFGIVLKPMSEDLSWSRAETTMAATAFFVVSALVMPIYGRLIDRYSLDRVMIISIAVTSLGFGLVAVVQTPWQFIFFYGIVFALGHSGFSILPVSVMVGRAFPDRTGIANSVAMSGFGFGQLIIISVLTLIVLEVGWRISHVYLAAGTASVLIPLLLFHGKFVNFLPDSPERYGGHPTDLPSSSVPHLLRFTISTKFAILIAVYALCGFQDFFMATHIASFATDNGVKEQFAGNLLAIMGVFALAGVIIAGFLGDKFKAGYPTVVSFLIRLVIFILICTSNHPSFIVILAFSYGFTFLITAPLAVVFVKDLFGTSRMGTLIGIVNMVHQFGGAIGAYAGGIVFDQMGSYQLMMILMVVVSLGGLICSYFIHGSATFRRRMLN